MIKVISKHLIDLKRINKVIFSLFFLVSALVIFISIFSYSPSDTSFNSVSNVKNVNNYLGVFGAYLADMFMQIFGFTSVILGGIFILFAKNIYFKKIRSGNFVKMVSFVFVVVSLSVLNDIIFTTKSCGIYYCEGILGNFFIDNLYDIPNYLLILLASTIFFISISFFLDLSRRWWVIKFARFYQFLKKTVILIFSSFGFILNLFFPRNFKIAIARLFGKKRGVEFIETKEIEEKQEVKKKKEKFSLFSKPKVEIDLNTNTNILEIVSKKSVEKKLNISKKDIGNKQYILPSSELLKKNDGKTKVNISRDDLIAQSEKLNEVLGDFSIKGNMIGAKAGPIITLYEFEPSAGTKSSRVIGLADDIARSMSAISTRISVIPGRNAMGIELPNKTREMIYLRDMVESKQYNDNAMALPIIIGSNIGGDPVIADLSKMPHLLIAGTTGSGKSVAINTMIMSLLYKMSPDQCKFIMIDPKMLELSVYDDIPHLLVPVVTEPQKAIIALKWVCGEMEDRYRTMAGLGVRNIAGYNEKLQLANKAGTKLTRKVQTGFDMETDEPIYEDREIENKEMPYIVVIVDEMADLMITAGKDIEASIQRLAQKARAAGIHIIMATQRPSVDVITGVIKANFPTRMSFQVVSKIDSRTILGEQGAEQLLGMGDMLFMAGGGKIIRAHGPFVSDNEVENIVNFIKSQGFKPNYMEEVLKESDEFYDDTRGGKKFIDDDGFEDDANIYDQAVNIVKRERKSSISYIQRQLRIGYNKAANLVEEMEKNGILSSPNNMGKREILIEE